MSEKRETEQTRREEQATRPAFARRVVIAVAIAIGMLAVSLFLWHSVHVLLLAFAAILIAVVLRGLSVWVAEKTKMPVGGALAGVTLSIVGFFVVLGFLLAPHVVSEFDQLAEQLPKSVDAAQERLRQYEWGRRVLGETPAEPPAATAGTVQPSHAGQGGHGGQGTVVAQAIEATTRPATIGKVVNYGRVLFEGVFTVVLVIIVGIYLAAQPGLYVTGLLMLFPKSERPRLREVLVEVGRTLRWWMIGQLVPMLAVGVLVGGGLKLIGVPLWLPLGILAALLNFIPNFGPIIAAVPAILIALAADPTKALWVVGLNLAAQNLEGYLITPMVQRRAVQMPPALTILSQVLLGMLLGGLGLILAAPLTASAIVIIKMLYVQAALDTRVKVREG